MKQEFLVYDERGNIWPPKFKSRLTNPDDPLCVVRVQSRDDLRRDRRASGTHRKLTVQARVFQLLQNSGPLSRAKINESMSDVKPKRIGSRLANLKKDGKVSLDTRGCYGGRGSGGIWKAIK